MDILLSFSFFSVIFVFFVIFVIFVIFVFYPLGHPTPYAYEFKLSSEIICSFLCLVLSFGESTATDRESQENLTKTRFKVNIKPNTKRWEFLIGTFIMTQHLIISGLILINKTWFSVIYQAVLTPHGRPSLDRLLTRFKDGCPQGIGGVVLGLGYSTSLP